jgi:hypothetical protein
MQLDTLREGARPDRPRPALVWAGLALLATLALVLALVIAGLALELGSGSAPPTTAPSPPSSSGRRQGT